MEKLSFIRYYRVFLNDTQVTEISANDFKPVDTRRFKNGWLAGTPVNTASPVPSHVYSLPTGEFMFYGYSSKIKAMEMAKSGALAHIARLVKNAERSILKLKQYRDDHYQNLNVNLLDSAIRKLEIQMVKGKGS
jgi:hypothetical protein